MPRWPRVAREASVLQARSALNSGVSVKRGPDTCGWRMQMADADGKMRMEKCEWKKMRITKKVRRKKREMRMAKKNK